MPPISLDPVARMAEQQNWITPQAEIAMQDSIRRAFASLGPKAEEFRDLLHGTWLHEPLHAVLTDVPVGAWTAAVIFDAIASIARSTKLDAAADASVILGLAGAVGASITGMNDWAEIKKDAPRRIGAVHALLNVGATALFGASVYSRRKKGSRGTARALAALGFVVVSASAHLGGNLVYEHGMGVGEPQSFEKKAPNESPVRRDPEDRPVPSGDERIQREKSLDKTLADSFPTSDPPSSIPDPAEQLD